MGIYIKKMEMPESCYYCPFADGVWQKDKRCLINGKEMPRDGRDVQQNHINCPLVPVPPHGRLIDADAVSLEGGPYEYDEWCKWALEQYQCAPTIIPADSKNIPDAIEERWAGIYFDALQTIIPASGGREDER